MSEVKARQMELSWHTTEVEEVFKAEKEEDLRCHGSQRRKRYLVCFHAEGFSSGVEEPDLKCVSIRDVPTRLQRETYKGKLDSEMCI